MQKNRARNFLVVWMLSLGLVAVAGLAGPQHVAGQTPTSLPVTQGRSPTQTGGTAAATQDVNKDLRYSIEAVG